MILGLGLDLVAVARVESLVARYPARAAARLFTEGEWTYASTKARPALHLAARFAAKEAAFKALAGTDDARVRSPDRACLSSTHTQGRPVSADEGAGARHRTRSPSADHCREETT